MQSHDPPRMIREVLAVALFLTRAGSRSS